MDFRMARKLDRYITGEYWDHFYELERDKMIEKLEREIEAMPDLSLDVFGSERVEPQNATLIKWLELELWGYHEDYGSWFISAHPNIKDLLLAHREYEKRYGFPHGYSITVPVMAIQNGRYVIYELKIEF